MGVSAEHSAADDEQRTLNVSCTQLNTLSPTGVNCQHQLKQQCLQNGPTVLRKMNGHKSNPESVRGILES